VSAPPTEARLYRGAVKHDRVRPARNRFQYGIYFMYMPIDRMGDVASELRLLSYNAPNLFSLWDRDHGPRDGRALRRWIDAVLAEAGIDLEGGPVTLLAFPRVLGARFFPISLWYCFHADGSCRAVLAEVHNTFRQHHNYLLHEHGEPLSWPAKPTVRKAFHVSPFIGMDAEYRFTLSEPGETLSAWIDDVVEGEHLLLAGVRLSARPLSDTGLLGAFLRFGPMSVRALVLIHWQALKLAAKRVGFYHTPEPPGEETSL
jgi:DUF1365 family protein